MMDWWSNLSLRGKLAVWGLIGIVGNMVTLPFGFFFPKLLMGAIAMLLIGLVMKFLGTSEKNETIDLSKLNENTTANIQFKIPSRQTGPLLHAAAQIFDPGTFRDQSDTLAQTITATKLYESGKKQFKVSYVGNPGSLLIC